MILRGCRVLRAMPWILVHLLYVGVLSYSMNKLPWEEDNRQCSQKDFLVRERFADALGNSVRTWSRGRLNKWDVLHSDREGPLNQIYRDALKDSFNKSGCSSQESHSCEIAADDKGTIAKTRFYFKNRQQNIRGRSTQAMISCRCVSKDCAKAVLLQPMRVNNGTKIDRATSCLYYDLFGDVDFS